MTELPPTDPKPGGDLHRYRRLLAMIVGIVVACQIVMAATSFGTDDVFRWMQFAAGVDEVGPYGVYELTFETTYNHPPLTGYLLVLLNALHDRGLRVGFVIRLFAILAGAVTPFLVLELARRSVAERMAFVAATSVAVSPALFAIGGFHGNTDPIFVMLTLLAAYLLLERGLPVWAGVALAAAIGIKLTPVVVLPTLAIAASLAGPRSARRFGAALAVTSMVLWIPALIVSGSAIIRSVLGYPGGDFNWGVTQLSTWGDDLILSSIRGPGRWLAVVLASVLPAVLVYYRRERGVEATALAMCGLLALATGFGIQYLAWAVAPAYLLSLGWATAFNVTASVFAFATYTRWSGEVPWFLATAWWFTPTEEVLAFLSWLCLIGVMVAGVGGCVMPRTPATMHEGTLLR